MGPTLYYFKYCPFCISVVGLARKLSVELNLVHLDLWKKEHLSDEYTKINAARTVPALIDGDLIIPESRSIMMYLVDKFAPGHSLYPRELGLRSQVNRFLFFDNGDLGPATRRLLVSTLFEKNETVPEKDMEAFEAKLNLLDTFLADKKFLLGAEPSLADVAISSTLIISRVVKYDFQARHPIASDWLERVWTEFPTIKEMGSSARDAYEKKISDGKAASK